MKRKVRIDRVLIMAIAVILVIVVVIFGVKAIVNHDSQKPNPTLAPSESPVSSFSMDLLEYKVYTAEALDFDFVLARFRFNDTEAVNYDLSRLKNDQEVALNDVSTYVDKLESNAIYLSKENVMFDIKSKDNSLIATLFIPVKKGTTSLTLTDDTSKKEFKLDLNQNRSDIKDLSFSTGESLITNQFDIDISDAYISDLMTRDGQPYEEASTVQIYTFRLTFNRIEGQDVRIVSAQFVPNGSSETFDALDGSYASLRKKDSSLVGKTVTSGTTGALFFEIFNPEEEKITYDGKIYITFSNMEKPIEISTELN